MSTPRMHHKELTEITPDSSLLLVGNLFDRFLLSYKKLWNIGGVRI